MSFVVHVVCQALPGRRVAVLARVGRHVWLVVDRRKPNAGEHAAILWRDEAPTLLRRRPALLGAGSPTGAVPGAA